MMTSVKTLRREPIPDDMKELAEKYRAKLIEHVADQDDELMEKYFNGEEFTVEEIKRTIRKSTIENKMVPITCGTSYRNKGVQPLLDAIVDYMPAPTDVPAIKGCKTPIQTKRKTDILRIRSRSRALAFKIATDPYVGSSASSEFIRVL